MPLNKETKSNHKLSSLSQVQIMSIVSNPKSKKDFLNIYKVIYIHPTVSIRGMCICACVFVCKGVGNGYNHRKGN